MTDPISNMLVSLKNAAMISKEKVVVPFSALKESIAMCLMKHGFVASVQKKTEKGNIAVLELTLAFDAQGPKIHDVARVSKPSRRMYAAVKEIHSFKNGHGMYVFSTPKGILSDGEARKEQVGGEVICKIW
jgi:small subunit ribosomal protein S8